MRTLLSLNRKPKSEDGEKSITISASLNIHNAQTKDTKHKSMVKPAYKERWLHLLVNS